MTTMDKPFAMPTEPPVIGPDDASVVGAGLVCCSLCEALVPVQAMMWIEADDEGDLCLVLDSDLRDLELHAATHDFASDVMDVS